MTNCLYSNKQNFPIDGNCLTPFESGINSPTCLLLLLLFPPDTRSPILVSPPAVVIPSPPAPPGYSFLIGYEGMRESLVIPSGGSLLSSCPLSRRGSSGLAVLQCPSLDFKIQDQFQLLQVSRNPWDVFVQFVDPTIVHANFEQLERFGQVLHPLRFETDVDELKILDGVVGHPEVLDLFQLFYAPESHRIDDQ